MMCLVKVPMIAMIAAICVYIKCASGVHRFAASPWLIHFWYNLIQGEWTVGCLFGLCLSPSCCTSFLTSVDLLLFYDFNLLDYPLVQ